MNRLSSWKRSSRELGFLFGLLMLSASWNIQAAGTMTPSIKYSCGGMNYDSAVQAEMCFYQAWINAYHMNGCGFDQLTWVETSTQLNGYVPFSPICGYGHVLPVVLPKVWACPDHSTGTTTCTCDVNYKPDPTNTSCISDCPVSDLPPVTDPAVQAFEDNPNLSDTSDLTPRMQTALSCLQTAAVAGSPSVGSAYRPPAYNQHLIDVWNKWVRELKNNDDSACADLKTKIQTHFQRHGLLETQSPVPGSLHTQGEAVDVSINLPSANIDALANGCQLRRPVPVPDPVHFIHQ